MNPARFQIGTITNQQALGVLAVRSIDYCHIALQVVTFPGAIVSLDGRVPPLASVNQVPETSLLFFEVRVSLFRLKVRPPGLILTFGLVNPNQPALSAPLGPIDCHFFPHLTRPLFR